MKKSVTHITAADIAARREENRDRATGHFGHGKLVDVADRSSFDDDLGDVHLEAERALALLNLYDRGEVSLPEARDFLVQHHGLTEQEAEAFLTQSGIDPSEVHTSQEAPSLQAPQMVDATVVDDTAIDNTVGADLEASGSEVEGSEPTQVVDAPTSSDTEQARCPQCQRYWDEKHECPEMTAEEKADACTENFLEAIESIHDSEDFKKALDFAASIHTYSFSNQLLLWAQHRHRTQIDPSTPADPGIFMGYNSWKSNGRYAMKGQRAYSILAPNKYSIREYRDTSGTWTSYKRKSEVPGGAETRSREGVSGFRVVKVHAEWQTDGEPIPKPPTPKLLEGGGVEGLTPTVEGLLTDMGYKVNYVDPTDSRLMGANGVTNPRDKEIWIRNDVSAGQQQKTLVHEFAHAKLHGDESFDYHGHRGFAETQAESVAYMVFKRLDAGFDSSSYSIPYVASWSASMGGGQKEGRVKEMRRALNGISEVTTSIMEAFTKRDNK